MDYTPVTPFRRTIDAVLLDHQTAIRDDLPPAGVNKWEVLRELATARLAFGLSDRDLTVLQALISFHQATILGGDDSELIVYPSNKAICERLNGMPCSTMRRHLSSLVKTGFLIRRDSPNGKRYIRRYGADKVAFGFDLTPLVQRFQEVCEAAEATRAAEERLKRLRSSVSLMRRDLAGLATYGRSLHPQQDIWDQFSDIAALVSRDLRRKLNVEELEQIYASLKASLDHVRDLLNDEKAEEMSTNDADFDHHYQSSDNDSYDLEPSSKSTSDESVVLELDEVKENGDPPQNPEDDLLPALPLGMVLSTCQEYRAYIDDPVRHWHDLVRIADTLSPMMGISPSAWDEAKCQMGPENAAVVVVAMLERFGEIRSPGGYLRSLSAKAAIGQFSCVPMVMALSRKEAA